jgi:hypothetical protein
MGALAQKRNVPTPVRPRATTIADFPAPPPPGSKTPARPPTAAPKPRDPLEVAREAIGELAFFADSRIAAEVCCAALMLALGASAVVIHSYDARARQIRVVAAKGRNAESLIGQVAGVDDDVIASTVIMNAAAMTLRIDAAVGLPHHAPERLRVVGASRVVVATPAIVKSRVAAIVEVVDAKESAATAVEPAAEYAGLALARFFVTKNKKKTK